MCHGHCSPTTHHPRRCWTGSTAPSSPHPDTSSPRLPRLALRCAVLCCAVLLRCDGLTALGRSLIAGSCPPVARPDQLPLRSQSSQEHKTTSSRPLRQISSRLHSYPSIALRLRLGAFLPRFFTRAHCSIPNWEPRPRKKTSLHLSISSGHNAVHHRALGSLNQQVHLDPEHHWADPFRAVCRYRTVRSTSVATVPLGVLPQFLALSRKISRGNTSRCLAPASVPAVCQSP